VQDGVRGFGGRFAEEAGEERHGGHSQVIDQL
jgi:hypothetical protein